MSHEQLERRLAAVEAEIAEIRRQLSESTLEPKAPRGWKAIVGSMKDFPEFEDVIRYGREFRQSDRPAESEQ